MRDRSASHRQDPAYPARILVTYVCAGVVLGALGLYKPLTDFAGCGATTPLTGFGYLISEGVREAVDEKGLLGALTGPLTASAAGITASLVLFPDCRAYLQEPPEEVKPHGK